MLLFNMEEFIQDAVISHWRIAMLEAMRLMMFRKFYKSFCSNIYSTDEETNLL